MKGAPRTAPERSPNGRRRPFGRRREMVRRAFPFSAKSRSSRNCARRAVGPDGPANESLHRQANRVPRLRAGRRGYGLERTRNDDRDDEIAGPKVGEITMDNEPLDAKSRRWRANALWPTGGRDNAPDAAIVCSAFP